MSVSTNQKSIYFVDSNLPDIDALLAGLPAGAEIVMISPESDGVTQMLAAINGREGFDAFHVLTHGAPGKVVLGHTTLTLDNLNDYASALTTLGSAMTPNADFLFYGCNVAEGALGQAFIEQLSALTAADVAASTDLTGASALGGDWVLEAATGSIEAAVISAEAMEGVLASGILKNKYVKFGYSDDGTLGVGGGTKPGIQYDPAGNRNFLDTADSLTPGSPFEGFTIKVGSTSYTENNSNGGGADQGTYILSTNLTTVGSDTYGSVTFRTTKGGLQIDQTLSLASVDAKVISTSVTVSNTSGGAVSSVKYARFTDPDVDSNGLAGSTSRTTNGVGASGIAASDIVLATGPVSGRVIGLYSDSSFAHKTAVSSGWSTDPAVYLAGANNGDGDYTIGIGFDLGNFAAGQSKTFSFAYVFAANATALAASVSEVPKSNPAPTLSSFTQPVDTTNEDVAVTITYAELISKGDEADLNADNTAGTVSGFVVKKVTSGTLTINGSAWAVGSNDVIATGKDAVWTPATNANGTLTAFEVIARDAEGSVSGTNVAVNVAVTAINDRPTLVSNATLRAITEDIPSASNIGSKVDDLFAPRFSDVDSGASLKGIVITANAEASLGAWQYSTDGTSWFNVGTVSTTAGLVLSAATKLRFAPDENDNGVPSALTVYALDNTYGTDFTSGATRVDTYNTTTATATGPLSSNTATLGVEVTAVNDVPTLTSTAATATITETTGADTAVGSGVTLAATVGSAVTDGKLTGTLAYSDVDHTAPQLSHSIRGGSEAGGTWTKQGLFGTLTLNADKTWSYEITKFDAINALPEGATATESFDFKVADTAGAAAVQPLTINLTGTNDTPILAVGPADQTLTGTGNWQYQIPAASFTDAEGTGLTYTVKVVAEGGVALDAGNQYAIGASTSGAASVASSWLTFDEASRTFTGNPPTDWGDKSLTFEVTASDGSLSATDSFDLTITGNTNQPPVVANPLQWAAANTPKEITTVTFGAALGGTTIAFDGSGDLALGSKATGIEVAAAFAGSTTNYTTVQGIDADANKLTLTATTPGARTDFTNGPTNISGGAYTAAVTQDGADAKTESWQVQFLGGTTLGAGTLTVLGQTVAVAATDDAAAVAGKVITALSADATWNVLVDGTNTDIVNFTAKAPGVTADLIPANFTYSVTADSSTPNPLNTGFDTDGLKLVLDGAAATPEIVTLTFDGAYGGADITIDGTTKTAGSIVSADDVATKVKTGAYTNYDTSGSGADVVFTAKTPGVKTDIETANFTVTNVDGATVSVTRTVNTQGNAWAVQVPANTFSDPDVGDTLTYTAYTFTIDGSGDKTYIPIATGDSVVPAAGGLLFDTAALKVFGDGSQVGAQYIEIRATDGVTASNQTATSAFQLAVYSNSQAPSLSAVAAGIPASVSFVDGAGSGSYTVPATAFNFVGESTNDLVYTLQVVDTDGTTVLATPAWLSINSATGTITGNPTFGSDDLKVKVTATATTGGSATTAAFTLVIDSPNDPLQLATALPDQTAAEGGAISILVNKPFTNPDGTAAGASTTEGVTYTATANGAALSTYGLTIEADPTENAGKLLISGNAPAGVAYLNIVVTGTETSGGDTETTSFTLNLGGAGASSSGAQRANDPGAVLITSSADIAAPKQGDVLTAQAPTDTDGVTGTPTYQWQVSANGTTWTDVAGARGQVAALTLSQTEVGLQLRVQAFYLDGGGFAEAPISSALPATLDVNDAGTVSISAGSSVGSTISAVISDADGLATATPTYKWQSATTEGGSYSDISGATYSSYTITSADGGKYLRVVTSYTDDQHNAETNITSAARNINLSQIAPIAAPIAGSATEASGINNATLGTSATGNLRTGATDANSGQAASLVVSGVRYGETLGLGRAADDGGATFTISGEFGDLVVTKATGAYTYTVAEGSEAVQALNSGSPALTEKFNFTLQDVDGLSDDDVLTISINGANDKPTISGQEATAAVVEDVPTALPLNVLAITDPDSSALTLILTVSAGTLRVNSLDSAITVSGIDTNTLTLAAGNPFLLRGWLADNAVLYVTPPNQNGAVATLSYSINDTSGAITATGTTAITATAFNDAPLIDADGNAGTTGNGAIAVFKPRGEAVKIASALTLTDGDASALNLTSATVTLASGAIDNQYGTIYEQLSLSAAGTTARTNAGLAVNITESAESVVLTLTGSATLAQYQAVLREVLYANSNPSAFTGNRAVTISATDSDGILGNSASFTTTATNASILVGQRIFINNVDSGAVVATVEDTQHFIASKPLTLLANDTLKFYSSADLPDYAFDGGGALVLAGSDSPLTTATVAAPRLATVTVQVPWTPVVDLNGEGSGRNHSVTFTENDADTGVAIATADSSITDQDGNLKQVTVSISNPQDGAAEKLFYTDAVATNLGYLNIDVIGNNTHTLTFSANTDASQFQPWLRAIQYVNTSDNPSVVPRQVVVTVTDAANNVGVPATTTVGIVAVNDAPAKGGDYAGALNEGEVYVFTTTDLNSTDIDDASGTLKYILTTVPDATTEGRLFRDSNNNNVVDTGEALIATVDTTSVAKINAITSNGYFTQSEVAAGQIKYAHSGNNPDGTNATGTDTFGFKVVDGMEDYAFDNIAANQAGTVTLTVTEVNDAPTGTPVVTGTMTPGQVLTVNTASIADADGPGTLVFSYQWKVSSDGSTWGNATGTGNATASYTLAAADQGKQVKVDVSFLDAFARSNTLTGAASGSVAFTNTDGAGAVTITDDGTPQAGETLTANTSALTDDDGLGPFSYQWQVWDTGTSGWVNVVGAISKTYSLPADAATGAQYKVAVSYTDGRGNAQSVASAATTLAAPAADVNDAPLLTGDGAFPATTTLFSNVAVSTVESGQTIQTLTLTVSGLKDGAAEKIAIDGVMVDLATAATTAITGGAIGDVSYAIVMAGTSPYTATITLTHAGLTEANTKSLVEGLALSGGTSVGLRVVTLSSLQDSGGGTDTGTIGLSATVDVGGTLPGSNTAPVVTGDLAAEINEGSVVALAAGDLGATDGQQPAGLKVVLASNPTNGTLFRDLNGNGLVDGTETALVSGDKFAMADITAGRIKYLHNGSETTTAAFDFNVSDGLALSDAAGGGTDADPTTFTITVTPVNEAPTLTATAAGSSGTPVAFAEGDVAKALFTAANASAVDTGQNITELKVMVSGLRDGAAEKLVVDGTSVALIHDTNGTSTGGGLVGYAVSVTGGTATVTLTKAAAAGTWNGLIDGLKYENTSQNPTTGQRSVTLTKLTDNGSDNNTVDLELTSVVAVTAVNDAPTLSTADITVTEGGSITLTTTHAAADDEDHALPTLIYTLSTAPGEGSVYIDADGDGIKDDGEALAANGTFSHAQLTAGQVRYAHNGSENGDTFALTVKDPANAASAPASITVTRTATNDAPTISGLGSDVLTYPANSGAKTLEQEGNVLVSDPDSANFNAGSLRVSISFNRDPAHDVLSIQHVGTAAGQISIGSGTVSYAGTQIGTFTGGTGTADLVVTFDADATSEAVTALVKAIQFSNDQAAPALTSRTVSFALNDGNLNGEAAPVAVNVNLLTGVTPSISIGNGFFVTENTTSVTTLSATDPNNRPITFSIDTTDVSASNQDGAKFEVVSGNLLRLKSAPDYEIPDDVGANRTYNVVVKATNDIGSSATQALSVTVLDQDPEAGITPGDTSGPAFGFATVNGNSLTITYTDASNLDATNVPLASAFAVSGNTVTGVAVNATAKTVTLTLGTAVVAGASVTVAYTDPTGGNDTAALQDAAGNDAATLAASSVSNVTPSTSSGGGGGSGGGSGGTSSGGTTTTVTPGTITGGTSTTNTGTDGTRTTTTTGTVGTVTVVETVVVTTEGKTVHELIYVPVSSGTAGGATTPVSLPLLYEQGAGGDSNTTITLPGGVGLTSIGDRTPTSSSNELGLIELIQSTVNDADSTKSGMLSSGQSFLDQRSDSSTLWINKIVLTATAGAAAPSTPIIVNGSANNASSTFTGDKLEALVIDASQLAVGSVINLENVDFAVVIGEGIVVRGGNGANIVFGGAGSQNILLGPDDDVLYGGDGDDVVGSAGGADQIFGNAGNDVVFGGAGADLLHGGADNDVATYSGNMARYEITRDHGKTIVRSLDRLDDIDTLINVETIRFDDQSYTVQNSNYHTWIASLYNQVLDRQPEIAGFQYWSASHVAGESIGSIALSFLFSAEHSSNTGQAFGELSRGQQVDAFYQYFLGRDADQDGHDYWINTLDSGQSLEQVANYFMVSPEIQGKYLQQNQWEFSL